MTSRPSIEWTTESRVEIRITIKSKIKIEANLLLGAAIILLATPGSLAGAAAARPKASTAATVNHANERAIWVTWILSSIKEFVGPSAAQPEPGRRLNWAAYFPRGLKSACLVPAAAWMPPSRCFKNSGSV